MRKAIAAAIILVCLASATEAEEFYMMGPGAQTCGQFGQSYAEYTQRWEIAVFVWAQGYMSGLNAPMLFSNSTTDLNAMSQDNQMAYIRTFCSNNPLKSYSEAVLDLYQDMRRAQGLPRWYSIIESQ